MASSRWLILDCRITQYAALACGSMVLYVLYIIFTLRVKIIYKEKFMGS